MESAIQQSCLNCALRPDRLFCDLPACALNGLQRRQVEPGLSSEHRVVSRGLARARRLCLVRRQGKNFGVFRIGQALTLRIAVPGEVLGLSAALSGTAHEVTAELLDNARVAMVKRKDLLTFLSEHREACLHVVTLLSQDLHVAYDRVRSVGLGRSRRVRSARAS